MLGNEGRAADLKYCAVDIVAIQPGMPIVPRDARAVGGNLGGAKIVNRDIAQPSNEGPGFDELRIELPACRNDRGAPLFVIQAFMTQASVTRALVSRAFFLWDRRVRTFNDFPHDRHSLR